MIILFMKISGHNHIFVYKQFEYYSNAPRSSEGGSQQSRAYYNIA
jgi:hypothetical protein